ncbi:MAG TPA: hypothetical protein VFQ22_12605 [Longimicrobiales bacterium]|nr:hypothetical protein [Longimicrobiales bacterium]
MRARAAVATAARTRPRAMAALAAFLVLAACDDGPDVGRLTQATVVGPEALGAAVLEVEWEGIEGFEGLGSTQVYHAPVPGSPSTHRVILVDPVGGRLRFGIRQRAWRTPAPAITVVDAVGADDLPLETSALRVRVEERRGWW